MTPHRCAVFLFKLHLVGVVVRLLEYFLVAYALEKKTVRRKCRLRKVTFSGRPAVANNAGAQTSFIRRRWHSTECRMALDRAP
jgi:hypothetical protein